MLANPEDVTVNKPSQHMLEALQNARKQPIRRVHDQEHGKPGWPHPSASLRALEARGWLTYSERKTKQGHRLEEWTLTDAGRQALLPREIFKVDRDEYLCRPIPDRRGDYTTNPAWSVDRLPIMDPDKVSLKWKREGRVRLAGVEDPRDRARRLARGARRAA